MAGGMNWSRARMDRIISERGSDRIYEPPLERPSDQARTTRRNQSAQTPASSRASADGKPSKNKRRKLRRQFEALAGPQRRAQASTYKRQILALYADQAAAERHWQSSFVPLLPAGTRASAKSTDRDR